MPNHIKNRLTFSGDQSKINELVAQLSTFYPSEQTTSFDGGLTFKNEAGNYGWLKDGVFSYREGKEIKIADSLDKMDGYTPNMEDEWTRFPDFEKVVPRPDGLDITSDGLVMYIENEFAAHHTMTELKEQIKRASLESVENFCKAIVNLKKHGFTCWYDWQVAHWGTKWNSYACKSSGENIWEFDTAWSGVREIVSKISEAYPTVVVLYEYADEDTGSSNCGTLLFEGGKVTSEAGFKSQSNEAYEMAFKLRPEDAEHYHLVDGKYEYKDEE